MTGEPRIEMTGGIKKEDVLAALKGMKAVGLDAYEREDLRAKPVQAMLDGWWKQIQDAAQGDPAAQIRASVERNLVLIEAGYDDAEMLDSVCEWLENDIDDAVRIKDVELAAEIRAKIVELEAKLKATVKK